MSVKRENAVAVEAALNEENMIMGRKSGSGMKGTKGNAMKENDAMKEIMGNGMNENDGSRPISPEEVYACKTDIIGAGKKRGLDYEDCEDLLQEIAYKCLTNSNVRLKPNKPLAAFLNRIARNKAIDIRRSEMRRKIDFLDHDELMELADANTPEPENDELRQWRIELIKRGIMEMNRKYTKLNNDAFIMFVYDGLTAKQVAEELNVEERYVNVAVHRGTKRLREIVRKLEREERWSDAG